MLNNIRKFAKTKFAGILIGLIIIPFVFWGMGGTFSSGNKNNLAKINNKSISTKDFLEYLDSSKIDLENLKENLDNNIIEQILAKLVSKKMLSMEVEGLEIIVSDKVLNKKIKKNKNFQDENNNFSRTKYEKFLLSSRITAPGYEYRLRENELQKDLLDYISGGLNTPLFLVNNNFKAQTKKITINYISLTNIYKKEEDFTDEDISKFIDENKVTLKEKFINFKYSKITPKNFIGLDEFNNLFFEKIDELENDLSNGIYIDDIQKKYNLELNIIENFKPNNDENEKEFYKAIYNNSDNKKIGLLDKNDFYILYQITDIEEILPNIKDEKFISRIKEMLFSKSKFGFNSDLIRKISKKEFTQSDFEKLSNNSTSKIIIDSINDDKKFTIDSIKYIYSKSKNDFVLVSDDEKNIYLIKIIGISYQDISRNSENFLVYKKQANNKIIDSIYSSYDFFINNKYDIKINDKTLERVKNYFR